MKKHTYLTSIRVCLMFLLALVTLNVQAQQLDTKGKDFWLAFPQNIGQGNLFFYISSETNTSGTITASGVSFSTTFSVSAGSVTSVTLPLSLNVSNANTVENLGIHVTANAEVTIYGLNQYPYTTDAYVALPTDILGTNYMAMNYNGNAQTTIVASQNSTSVTITSTESVSGFTAGVPRTITMNQGQTFKIQSSDGTGSTITSDKPIGVYGGSPCINVPSTCYACDHIVEMLPPIETWGKNFVVMPLATRTGSTYRILASENSTTVSINGSTVATLSKGQFYNTVQNNALYITSNKPVLVGQYAHGSSCDGAVADPFFMLIPPYEQYLGSYTFATPGSGFVTHWANIIAPSAAVGDVKLDGSTIATNKFSAIGSSGFYGATIQISNGSHTIKSNYPIGAHIYGWGDYDSYGYPGGSSLSPVGYVANLSVSPSSKTLTQYNQHCVTATVTDNLDAAVAGIRVDFAVTGANTTGGFATTDANGQATFCYTGNNSGNDAIRVTTGSLSASSTATFNACTIRASETHTNISCGGKGSIDLTVTNNVGTYSVLWTGPNSFTSTSEDLTNLDAGTYNVKVTDNNGCPASLSVQITAGADNTLPTVKTQDVTVYLDASGRASILEPSVTMLNENFSSDADNTYTSGSITNWNILSGGIDLGDYTTAISGKEIDLSAWTNGGIESKTTYTFSPGTYTLSFDQVRNTVDNPFTVTIGSFVSQNFNSTATMKQESITFTVTSSTTGKISFVQGGTSDANGSFVGNIKLVKQSRLLIENGSTDNCSVASISASKTDFNCDDLGDNSVTLTVTDGSGNRNTGTATVTVADNIAPVAKAKNITVYLDGNGSASITASDINDGSSDNCSTNLSIDKSTFGCSDVSTQSGCGKYSLKFDGSNDYAISKNSISHGSFTYEAWVNATSQGSNFQGLVTTATNGANDNLVQMSLNSTGKLMGEIMGPNGLSSRKIYECQTAITNGWHHVAMTFDGTNFILYVDGVKQTVTKTDDQNVGTLSVNRKILIGAERNLNIFAKQTIDEVRIWNTARSQADIKSTMFSCLSGTENGLIAYWPIEEGSGTTIKEKVSANDATMTNMDASTAWQSAAPAIANATKNAVTLTVKDAAGNSNTATAYVEVKDNTAPTVVTKNATLSLDASGKATLSVSDINNGSSDNCTIASYSLDKTTFTCANIGNNTVTLTVTDANGNSATATATVTVKDATAPTVVTKNITVSLDAGGNATITTASVNNGSSDNCGITSYSLDKSSFNCSNLGANTVRLTATDGSNNSASATATVTVQDATAPTVKAKNITVNLDASGKASITPQDVDNGSSDNCTVALSLSKKDFTCADLGNNSITLTGTDPSNNTASATATVTVVDNTNPTVSTKNVTVTLDANGKASITTSDVNNGSSDNCSFTLSLSKKDFTCSDLGNNTVTLTATDGSNNTASATAVVTVKDATAPYLRSKDINAYLDANGKVTVTPTDVTDSTNDNCGTVNVKFGSGSSGTTCGSASENGTVSITVPTGSVITRVDFASYGMPTGTCGSYAVNSSCHASGSKSIVESAALGKNSFSIDANNSTFGDPCVGTVKHLYIQVSYGPLMSKTYTCANLGDNTVSLYADDSHGNTTTGSAKVTVKDTIKPKVITKNVTVALDASGKASITTASVNNGSSDNCGIASLSLDKTDFTCSNTGSNTVKLTATDGSGNSSSATATVTVIDNTNPTVRTKNISVDLDAHGQVSIAASDIDDGTFDNCSFSLSIDKSSFDCSKTGNNTVTLKATDASGNVTTGTATVTVKDATAPTVITKDITVYLDASGAASITTASVDDHSYDNCSFTLSLDKTSFDCTETGDNTVTLTAKDASGNETSKTAVVTVKDAIAPTVVTKDITIYLDANGAASITTASVDNGSYDNCHFTLALDKTSFDCSNTGDNTVTLTATDASNNTTSQTAVVTVKDAIAPTVITKDITIYLDANGAASITTASVDNGSYDNCRFTLSLDKTSFDCSETGDNTVTLTAKDASGNETSETAVVTVKDAIAPTVVTKDITIYLDANGAASITTASVDDHSYDNCSFTLSLDKTSFNCTETGDNTVTLTAKDASGNTTSETAVVTVKDAIAPTVITQDITVYLDANGAASITTASVDNGSYDNCHFTLSLDKTSFSCSNTGDNTVTLTATDASNNTTSETAVVTVKDAIAPTVVTKDVTIYLDANGAASITTASVDNGSYDNCSFTLSLDKTSFNCSNVGENTVELTATDASGNVTTKTATVTVKDVIAPTVVTKDITVYLDATGAASITTSDINNGSTDNCTIASYSLDKTSFSCSNTGDNTVTMTVSDVNGNSASATAVVTVKDAIDPVAKAKNISVTLDNTTGSASITTTSVDDGSYDNCSFTLSLDKTSFSCSNVGDNTVTLTATDASGNTNSTTAVVTVKTTLTASAGSDVTVYYGYAPMASATLTATGNGGNGSYTYKWSTGATTKSITVSPTTTTTYTVTITDGKGCTAKDEVKVTVVDVRCGNKNDKVMVCHNGHTICIDASAVPAHLSNHSDDYIGDCGSRSTTGDIVDGETGGGEFVPGHAAAQISAYPNPFATSTTIEFTLGRTQNASLEVYDIKGARVATLFQGVAEEGVTNYYSLDAKNLKADVYFARLITEREVKIVKLIIVR